MPPKPIPNAKRVGAIKTSNSLSAYKGSTPVRPKRKNGDPAVTNVFITVNTNLKPPASQDAQIIRAQLERAADRLTRDAAGLDRVTTWYDERGWKGNNILNGSFEDGALVESVTTEYAVERGGRQNSMHVHLVIRIHHRGTLWFDRLKLKNFFMAEMGSTLRRKPNVQVKLLGNPNEAEALRGYLIKDLMEQSSASYNKPSK